jgi:hypothetical protein
MVVEVSYVEWTPDGLLRHVVYLGEREDKLASDVSGAHPTSASLDLGKVDSTIPSTCSRSNRP